MPIPDAQAWLDSGEFLDFRGHRLFALRGGHGPALLLIHGFPTSSLDWARAWPTLALAFECHAIDMLGFGQSDKPRDYAYSIAASADQWQALALMRGLSEVTILAHDYGDTVAQELLARQREGRLPFRIRSAAFLNGGLFPEATFPLLLQRLLLGPFGPLLARLSSYRSFAASLRRICARPLDDAELREHWRLLVRADGRQVLPKTIRYIRERRLFRERWLVALQEAGIPLCLIDGTADPISGASIVRRWRELLPQATVVELDGVGHYPQIEAAERVLAAFLDFQN
jgi:pimeloyl-ACP methyl ester carboxylesterase